MCKSNMKSNSGYSLEIIVYFIKYKTRILNINCTTYTVRRTLCIVMVHDVQCTLYSVQPMHCTLYSVQSMHCTLYSVQPMYCTLYSVHCTAHALYIGV